MLRTRSAEDALIKRLVGKGSRKGGTPFSRAGDFMRRPPSWAAVAAVLAVTGPRGRRAALRGSVCYLSAAAVHLPLKALVGRRHPPGAALLELGPFTSSFPSGHAASDLAFVFGAAHELPGAFVPLACGSLAVHWALVRRRAHYPSDVLVGGALGIAVALTVKKVWPPRTAASHRDVEPVASRGHGASPASVEEGTGRAAAPGGDSATETTGGAR